jgi:tRNA(Ile)-lysidine synthase
MTAELLPREKIFPLARDEFAALPGMAEAAHEKAIALALSGGPDSMALCRLLSQWAAAEDGPEIHALTIDHGLRPEAAAEARRVGEWVKGWPHVRHAVLTLKKSRAKRRIMETARQGRYESLADYCRRRAIGRLFTAHHLDDQAETFLFRLAKGSGPDGLAAMRACVSYDAGLSIVRPLLGVAKDRLMATCRHYKIPFAADPTNDNPVFARNRLRQAQKILAREGLTAKRLAVTAARMGRACEALDYYARETFDRSLRGQDGKKTAFDFAALAAAPAEISLRVLLRAMKDDGYGPRREGLEALAADLFSRENFKKRTLGGFMVSRDWKKGLIVVEKEQ